MKILIVDSSELVREKLRRYLELENQFDEIFEAEFVVEAKMILEKENIDVILFDIQLSDDSGLELVTYSRSVFPNPVLILFTNYKFPQYLSIYKRMSINYCFDKSTGLSELKNFFKKHISDFRNQTQISCYS